MTDRIQLDIISTQTRLVIIELRTFEPRMQTNFRFTSYSRINHQPPNQRIKCFDDLCNIVNLCFLCFSLFQMNSLIVGLFLVKSIVCIQIVSPPYKLQQEQTLLQPAYTNYFPDKSPYLNYETASPARTFLSFGAKSLFGLVSLVLAFCCFGFSMVQNMDLELGSGKFSLTKNIFTDQKHFHRKKNILTNQFYSL